MKLSAAVLPPTTRSVRWASPKQKQQFEHGPTPVLASGGWGAAKTTGFVLKAIYLSTEFPRNRGIIARHVGKELRATTMSTFYKWCPPRLYDQSRGGRRNDQNGYLKFAESGSEILFLNLDDPETQGIIRGLEANWFLIDQAEEDEEHMEENFDLLCGRMGRWDIAEVPQRHIDAMLRESGLTEWPYKHPDSGRNVPPPYMMLTCNPDIETHWLYRRFHPESEEWQTIYKAQGYTFIDMPSLENQFLGDINKNFLLSRDSTFIRRNVDGIWGMPEGAIHHVPKLAIIPGTADLVRHLVSTCLLSRTGDHGDSAPTAVGWWAVDREGNVFLFREYYSAGKTVSVHRRNIYELSKLQGSESTLERYETNLMDPSAFTKLPQKKGGRWAVTDEYADVSEYPRETAIFWERADNNELGTRNRINEYLTVDPNRVHPIYKTLGSPRMFFITATDEHPQGVIHALKQTRSARRLKVGTELGKPIFSDERAEGVDHAYDFVRYFLASRPAVPLAPAQLADGTFFGAQQRLAALNRRRMGMR